MNGYIALYKSERKELYADTLYGAKKLACELWRVPQKLQYKVSVHLAEKDGKPVIHDGAEIG